MKNIESIIEEMYVDLSKSLGIDVIHNNGKFNSIKYFGPQLKDRKCLINETIGGYYFLGLFKNIPIDPIQNTNIIYCDNESAIMLQHQKRRSLSNFEYYEKEITLFCIVESFWPKKINFTSDFKSLGLAILSSFFILPEERIVYDSFALTFRLDEDHLKANNYNIEDIYNDWNWLNYISEVFKECVERYRNKF